MRLPAVVCLVALVTVSCAGYAGSPGSSSVPEAALPTETTGQTSGGTTTTTIAASTTSSIGPTTTATSPFSRPSWLGTRVLPLRSDGYGEVLPTPPELVDRRLETIDLLPPPPDDSFHWTSGPVPPEVVARSSWTEECPVGLDELVYLTMSHLGFDGRYHTGEMIVNAQVEQDVVEVFRRLHEAGFPIEEMRVIRADEIDAPPTGDGNDTTSFACRPAVGTQSWSQHAYGLAIDVNEFQNPYVKGDLVLPELASSYVDRANARPGMIFEGDVVTEAFDAIGWGWGGRWSSLVDWMHFSLNGR